MSQEWLEIQSFFADQQVLQAINDLSIALKQELAGVHDVERADRAGNARATLSKFLRFLEERAQDESRGEVLGLDSRAKELVEAFFSARHDSANFQSTLMRAGPQSALAILTATDTRSKRELLACLADLRRVVARHQQMDVSAIFEDV